MIRYLPLALIACGSFDLDDPAAGGTPGADGAAGTVTIAYQSRADGEIEPCG